MSNTSREIYGFAYERDGRTVLIDVSAKGPEEAQQVVAAMAKARYVGKRKEDATATVASATHAH